MKPGITSKEDIMQVCRKIAAEQGLPAVNMRAVAKECGIALGTLYNYYASKDELLMATVESVWKDIFHMDGTRAAGMSFPDYAAYLFDRARTGAEAYPGFLGAHSIAVAKSRRGQAKSIMEHTFEHMKAGMLTVLRADTAADTAVFSPAFQESDLVDFVLDQILLLLVKGADNSNALVELIRRVIYQ
ncbi:MAG: TetR/AcrR family transcriptional regulator [Lachnospiraceae bacterium]|nr:TetR/AcrR family transcriptional regulator [Lachnospiraceae bacterium]